MYILVCICCSGKLIKQFAIGHDGCHLFHINKYLHFLYERVVVLYDTVLFCLRFSVEKRWYIDQMLKVLLVVGNDLGFTLKTCLGISIYWIENIFIPGSDFFFILLC